MEKQTDDPKEITSLPEGLRLVTTSLPGGAVRGVFSIQNIITKGTRYGPYTGDVIRPEDGAFESNNALWEVSTFFVWIVVLLDSNKEVRFSIVLCVGFRD